MESNLSEMIQKSLDSIRQIAGTETVIGEPINTAAGTIIIPVSKVSIGFATGGLDSAGGSKTAEDPKSSRTRGKSFGGGGGTGMTVAPIAFLVISPSGTVELLNIASPTPSSNALNSVGSLLEKSPDILSRIKDIFAKDKTPESPTPASSTEEEPNL